MNLLDNLTGEARGKFKSWFIENITLKTGRTIQESIGWSDIYKLPPSMQIGVLIDWAESEGYQFYIICKLYNPGLWYFVFYQDAIIVYVSEEPFTRHEAYEASVKKLNELIN